jgi:hypothetical protein
MVLGDATLVMGVAPGETSAAIQHPPDPATAAWAARLAATQRRKLHIGSILTSPRVLVRASEKRAAGATGALAVEMEAGPLARWAGRHGVPFVHLRVVLDPVSSSLPDRDEGEGQGRAVGSWLRRAVWSPVWRLRRQIRIAGQVVTELTAALVSGDGPLAPGR